jgi:hypothetical protein
MLQVCRAAPQVEDNHAILGFDRALRYIDELRLRSLRGQQ